MTAKRLILGVSLCLLLLVAACAKSVLPPELSSQTCGDWFAQVPAPDGQFLYFVGVSKKHSVLAGARDDALAGAAEQFVKYTGMSVSTVDRYLAAIDRQAASGLMDPTITEQRRRIIRARAFVTRVKAEAWCDAEGYESAVKASVPLDEPERVAEWARLKRDELLRTAAERYTAATAQAAIGQPLSALQALHASRQANEEASLLSANSSPESSAVSIATIEQAEAEIRAGLHLSLEGPETQAIEPGDSPNPVRLVTIYHYRGTEHPVPGLPLVVVDETGANQRGVTGANGQIVLNLSPIDSESSRRYLAGVDTEKLAESISSEAVDDLERLRVSFSLSTKWRTPAEKAADLVAGLEEQLDDGSISVVVENFVYKDVSGTAVAGEFARRFADFLEEALVKSGRFTKKKRVSRRGLTRGLTDLPSATSPAALAYAADSQAVLYGNYFEQGDRVVVQGRLADRRDNLLAAETVRISTRVIPDDWSLKPANYSAQAAIANEVRRAGDFRLDLWIDRGNGGVYSEGDKLYASVRAEVDCYLKLVHVDAAGAATVVFPNVYQPEARLEAERVYVIPGEQAGFEFGIQPPFGAETLVAFASTSPFPPDRGREIGKGMVRLEGAFTSVVRGLRGVTTTDRDTRYAEARTTFTTVAR